MNPGLWSVIRIDISYTGQGFVNKDMTLAYRGDVFTILKTRSYIHQSPSVGFGFPSGFLLVLAQWNQTLPVTRGVLFPQPMAIGHENLNHQLSEDPRLHFNQRRIATSLNGSPQQNAGRELRERRFSSFFLWIFFGKAERFWENQHKTVVDFVQVDLTHALTIVTVKSLRYSKSMHFCCVWSIPPHHRNLTRKA